ncbi:MAG: peptidoglycan DD-metalloendopeptidase family protein, partial [Paracoccaceae bacterium]
PPPPPRASLAALQGLRGEIAALMDRNRRLERLPKEVEERLADEAAALSASAASLRALSAALPPPQEGDDTRYAAHFAAARALAPPAEGALTRGFAAPGRGGALEGVEIAAPAYASVYAPWRGVIRFAGPFGDDGVVVILEPDPDFLIVLAGLAATDRVAGEVVLAGEPLGAMGGPPPAAEEFLIAATAAVETIRAETLYMEVRRGGAPADPALWFAFDNEEGD